MRRILVTGKNGQVGSELQQTLITLGEVVAPDRATMNLADADSIRGFIRELKPDIVVNAAAYTAVDKAESEPELALAVNGVAPGIMAEEVKRLGAVLVHYSTDYVFDGTKEGAYTEEDTPNPLSVYGDTKLAGERAIREIDCPHLILRTSWVYGARGKNFLLTVLRLAKERPELRVVYDQIGAPTWSRHIAEATALILAQCHGSVVPCRRSDLRGIYHLTAGGHASWFDFAKAIVDIYFAHKTPVTVSRITSEEYRAEARRPKNSVLSNQKLTEHFRLAQPDWNTCLETCLAKITEGTPSQYPKNSV